MFYAWAHVFQDITLLFTYRWNQHILSWLQTIATFLGLHLILERTNAQLLKSFS